MKNRDYLLLCCLGLLLLLSSCSQPINQDGYESWTEHEIRRYFEDSIAHSTGGGYYKSGISNFDTFALTFLSDIKARNLKDHYYYAMHEPYIDTTEIPVDKQWIRVMVYPGFSYPYCLTYEKVAGKTHFTLKRLGAKGQLRYSFTQYLNGTRYDSVLTDLEALSFWSLGMDKECDGGLDGTVWIIEGIHKGKYNHVRRWEPEICGTENTRKLGALLTELEGTSMVGSIDLSLDYLIPLRNRYIEEIEKSKAARAQTE